jgi:predicted nucleotidyltransferase
MRILEENVPADLANHKAAIIACLHAFNSVAPIHEVRLFGSFARGGARPDSDVDLCIVAEGADRQLAMARRFRRAVREIRPKPAFTLVPISPSRLREKEASGDHFFKTVLEEGIKIASED